MDQETLNKAAELSKLLDSKKKCLSVAKKYTAQKPSNMIKDGK